MLHENRLLPLPPQSAALCFDPDGSGIRISAYSNGTASPLPPTNAHDCVQVPSSPLNDAALHNGSNVHVQSVSASAWPSTTAGSPVGSDYVMVVMSVCASPTFSEVRRQDLLDLPDLSDPPMSR